MTDHNVSTTEGDIHVTDDGIDATDHVEHRSYNRPGMIDQLWKKIGTTDDIRSRCQERMDMTDELLNVDTSVYKGFKTKDL
jgi:hypothetical protein